MTLFTEPKIFAKDLDVTKYQNMMSLNLGNDPLRKEGSSNVCDTQYILHDSCDNYLNITLLFLKGIDNFRKQTHLIFEYPLSGASQKLKVESCTLLCFPLSQNSMFSPEL